MKIFTESVIFSIPHNSLFRIYDPEPYGCGFAIHLLNNTNSQNQIPNSTSFYLLLPLYN